MPKRKYAIFFGYDGSNYHGMQKQIPGSPMAHLPTVEGALEAALIKVGGFSEEHLAHYSKLQWSRVGRTDKGVHAACQVVTCRLSLGPLSEEHKLKIEGAKLQNQEGVTQDGVTQGQDGLQEDLAESPRVEGLQRERELDFIRRLRQELPADFVLYDVRRVPNQYDARLQCLRRQYEYCFPSHVLRPCVLQDNSPAVRTFFDEFCPDYEEPGETPYKDAFQATTGGELNAETDANGERRSVAECVLQNFGEKQTIFEALRAETASVPWDMANEGPLAPLLSRHRREVYAVRRAYAALSPERRHAAWLRIHGSSPLERGVPEGGLATEQEMGAEQKAIETQAEGETQVEDGAEVEDETKGVTRYAALNYPPPELLAIGQPPMSREARSSYRMSEADFAKFETIIGRFLGRHNWFSYTSRLKATDPSANRNLFAIEVHRVTPSTTPGGVAADGPGQCEFIVVRLKGESFLYNQIRKMMSLAMETMIGTAPSRAHAYLTSEPLLPKKHIHLAPGEGLMLERAYYETLNRPTRELCPQMVLHHPLETDDPYGEEVQTLLKHPEEVKTLQSAADALFAKQLDAIPPTANPLFDDNDQDNDEKAGQTVADDEVSDDEVLPVWYQVLQFKFQKLLPRMTEVFNEQETFDLHAKDLAWHPFFAENFPIPRDTSFNNPPHPKGRQ
ncbi:tRNA pseudouridine synthase [Gregarina niphandrodes]|uniref:tRNA pseudouridine synthase n=1 Tax=Gregarina niphandrodes TaxID=110365 RepID=A0A023BBJ2_GRENI|nr:tRNA pseudouridine synthase [Gregarina niphandrodes]EZG79936.1 tRNA pseudouridine synthase [Gregarina niphandrodes]|eukprot:XP_011134355.1 tRNA pseudouridine synthase [Gregarina niphandrodes]